MEDNIALSINFPVPNPFLMRLSTLACFARLLFILLFCISGHQAVSQNLVDYNTAQEVFSPSFEGIRNKSFEKFVAVHIAPTKIIAGELPVTLAVRVSPSWMLEVGAGPAFRD